MAEESRFRAGVGNFLGEVFASTPATQRQLMRQQIEANQMEMDAAQQRRNALAELAEQTGNQGYLVPSEFAAVRGAENSTMQIQQQAAQRQAAQQLAEQEQQAAQDEMARNNAIRIFTPMREQWGQWTEQQREQAVSNAERIMAAADRNFDAESLRPVFDDIIQNPDSFGMYLDLLSKPAELPADAQTIAYRAREGGLVPGTPEYQQYVLSGGPQSGQRPALQRVSALVRGEQTPTTLLFDSQSGQFTRQNEDGSVDIIPSGNVTQVSIQGGAGDVMPPARLDTLQAERDWLAYQGDELTRMISAIGEDPTLAGAAGQVRRFGQQLAGGVQDLAALFGPQGAQRANEMVLAATNAAMQQVEDGTLSEENFKRLFDDPDLSQIALFENTLGFTLARLRSPDGRLLASIIDRSLDDARITGFTSSRDVIAKLSEVQRQLETRRNDLDRRMGRTPATADAEQVPLEDLLQQYAPLQGATR